MLKKSILATIAVFVAWQILDFIIHGLILKEAYAATASLWRPLGEMKMGLMYPIGFIAAACFVTVYTRFVHPKSVSIGFWYGAVFGLGTGISMGYGSYCVMPISHFIALAWFFGTLAETLVAGLLVGAMVKESV